MNEDVFKGRKILFVSTISRTLRAFLLPYSQAIRERGGIVDAMYGENVDILRGYFRKIWLVKFTRNPALAVVLLPYTLMHTRKIILEEKYDIVSVHTPIASFVTRLSVGLIKKGKRPRVIYTAHGFHFHPLGSKLTNWIYLRLEKFAARYTDYLITINEWDYNVALKERFLPKDKIFYIKGIGVDSYSYDPAKVNDADIEELKREIGCIDAKKILCVIGEFNPSKRHIDVLKTLKYLTDKDIRVVFVGDGKLKENMYNRAKEMGLSEKALFLGYRHDVPRILKASVALLMPSIREGMPRVVMEAMAMETPVIATNIRGVRELLSDDCGILVEPKNPKVLAEAIKWIIENEEEAKIKAKNAQEKIKRVLDINVVLPQHLAVYEAALLNNRK